MDICCKEIVRDPERQSPVTTNRNQNYSLVDPMRIRKTAVKFGLVIFLFIGIFSLAGLTPESNKSIYYLGLTAMVIGSVTIVIIGVIVVQQMSR